MEGSRILAHPDATSAPRHDRPCAARRGRPLCPRASAAARTCCSRHGRGPRTVPPRHSGTRQPVHTCYVPADPRHGADARPAGAAAVLDGEEAGRLGPRPSSRGSTPAAVPDLVERVARKLRTEPVRGPAPGPSTATASARTPKEDADAVRAAHTWPRLPGTAPPARLRPRLRGIRFKCFDKAATRARGAAHPGPVLSTLGARAGPPEAGVSEDGLPEGLALTLPRLPGGRSRWP
ncbi:hypothetical protein QJS66_10735 [Kocuria rhizophila]|nr:hypothetical protein QJS66_10735 [Kocuria rhizophila]